MYSNSRAWAFMSTCFLFTPLLLYKAEKVGSTYNSMTRFPARPEGKKQSASVWPSLGVKAGTPIMQLSNNTRPGNVPILKSVQVDRM